MTTPWHTGNERVRPDLEEEARQPPLAFITRILLVLFLVAAFLFLFKRSSRLDPRLQAVLDAEEEAIRAGDWRDFSALLDPDHAPFRQHQKEWFDSVLALRRGGSYVFAPYPLQVTEAGRRDDRAWARVTGETPDGEPVYRVEFFRQAYGHWLHTGPDPAWWGAERDQRTAHVVWRYREAEEGWISGMAPLMEQAHARACADLGLDPRRHVVTIDLCYSVDCVYLPLYPSSPTIELPAPLLVGWGEEMAGELLPGVVVGHLLTRANPSTSRAAGSRPDQNVTVGFEMVLMDGIRLWETERVTGVPVSEAWLAGLHDAAADGLFLSLDEMTSPSDLGAGMLRYGQGYALVDYLVASQGVGTLPALVHAATPSRSLREALQEVLGPEVDLAAFEQAWMAWMREKYGE